MISREIETSLGQEGGACGAFAFKSIGGGSVLATCLPRAVPRPLEARAAAAGSALKSNGNQYWRRFAFFSRAFFVCIRYRWEPLDRRQRLKILCRINGVLVVCAACFLVRVAVLSSALFVRSRHRYVVICPGNVNVHNLCDYFAARARR